MLHCRARSLARLVRARALICHNRDPIAAGLSLSPPCVPTRSPYVCASKKSNKIETDCTGYGCWSGFEGAAAARRRTFETATGAAAAWFSLSASARTFVRLSVILARESAERGLMRITQFWELHVCLSTAKGDYAGLEICRGGNTARVMLAVVFNSGVWLLLFLILVSSSFCGILAFMSMRVFWTCIGTFSKCSSIMSLVFSPGYNWLFNFFFFMLGSTL